MFTQAELERANLHMHARFLSVSDQIFRELSRLERHIEAAPLSVRAFALAAVAQIASMQQWLRAQTEHLPPSPLQRFEILRSSLDAQQGALRHLSIIVAQHAPPDWPPRNALAAPAAHLPSEVREPRHALAIPHNRAPSPDERMRRAQADAVALARYFHAEAIARPDHRLPSHGSHWHDLPVWSQQAHPSRPSNHAGHKSGNLRLLLATANQQVNGAGPRSLGWVTTLVAVAALGYGMLPQAILQRDVLVTPVETAAPTMGPGAVPPAAPPVRPDAVVRSHAPAGVPAQGAPSPPQSEPAGAAARPEPAVLVPAEPALLSAARSIPPPVPAPAPDAWAPSDDKHAASKVDTEPAAPTPTALKERFVPVVFTHRDEGAAMRAFGALQHKFPGLLAQRQGEAQPVDFGKKGTWHRLVVLPPRPRPQATKLCDQLLTAGYDRCWVKVY